MESHANRSRRLLLLAFVVLGAVGAQGCEDGRAPPAMTANRLAESTAETLNMLALMTDADGRSKWQSERGPKERRAAIDEALTSFADASAGIEDPQIVRLRSAVQELQARLSTIDPAAEPLTPSTIAGAQACLAAFGVAKQPSK